MGVRGTGFDGSNNYNSLQVTVRKQFSHGLTMPAAYTWSKDLTDLSNIGANPTNSNDASSLSQQYGQATFSPAPQRFVVSYNYDLPFGTHPGLLGGVDRGMERVRCNFTSRTASPSPSEIRLPGPSMARPAPSNQSGYAGLK